MIANSSISSHLEMLIDYKFLHDLPSYTSTLFVIGTPVKLSSLILGAKYPILFIKSLEISVLNCKSKYFKLAFKIFIRFCSSITVFGNFYIMSDIP